MGASERNETKRRIWHRIVSNLDPRRLVFVDESGANITLARRYGRSPRGERSPGRAPRNYTENLTLVAALSLCMGIEALIVLQDVCGLEAAEAVEVSRWAAQALLQAGLREATASSLKASSHQEPD